VLLCVIVGVVGCIWGYFVGGSGWWCGEYGMWGWGGGGGGLGLMGCWWGCVVVLCVIGFVVVLVVVCGVRAAVVGLWWFWCGVLICGVGVFARHVVWVCSCQKSFGGWVCGVCYWIRKEVPIIQGEGIVWDLEEVSGGFKWSRMVDVVCVAGVWG